MAWKKLDKDVKKTIDDYHKMAKDNHLEEYVPSTLGNKAHVGDNPFEGLAKSSRKWKKMENTATKETTKMAGSTQNQIEKVLDDIRLLLLTKNEQYGDSALSPNRIFSKASTDEQIKFRIDDKLNRLMLGNDSIESDDDIIKDLIGYLVLLLVSQGRQD